MIFKFYFVKYHKLKNKSKKSSEIVPSIDLISVILLGNIS